MKNKVALIDKDYNIIKTFQGENFKKTMKQVEKYVDELNIAVVDKDDNLVLTLDGQLNC